MVEYFLLYEMREITCLSLYSSFFIQVDAAKKERKDRKKFVMKHVKKNDFFADLEEKEENDEGDDNWTDADSDEDMEEGGEESESDSDSDNGDESEAQANKDKQAG